MDASIVIRPATEPDAPDLLDIYRPFVESTAVSFEYEPPTAEAFARRITKSLADWQWLVAEQDERCIAYAYGSSHRERAAYRWSVEVSAYVHPGHLRRGVGRALYSRLFDDLARLSLEFIGVFKAVGCKFDRWHDVAWYQRSLPIPGPAEAGEGER